MATKTEMDVFFPGKPTYHDGEQVQFCVDCMVWVPVTEKKQHLEQEHFR